MSSVIKVQVTKIQYSYLIIHLAVYSISIFFGGGMQLPVNQVHLLMFCIYVYNKVHCIFRN